MRTISRHGRTALRTIRRYGFSRVKELEQELLSAHRELSELRHDYLELGVQASTFAGERDTALEARKKTEEYIAFVRPRRGIEARGERPASVDAGGRSGRRHAAQAGKRYATGRAETASAGGRRFAHGGGQGAASDALGTLREYFTPRPLLLEGQLASVRRELARLGDDYLELADRANTIAAERDTALRDLQEAQQLAETLIPGSGIDDREGDQTSAAVSADAADRLASTAAKLDHTQSERNDLTIKLAESEDAVEALRLREAQLREELDLLRQRLSTAEQEHTAALRKAQQLATELETARGERAHVSEAYQEQVGSLQQRLGSIESELDATRQQVASLQAALAEVSFERESTLEQLQAMGSELQAERARLAEQAQRVNAMEAREAQLRSERDSISERLTLTESEQAAAIEARRVLSEELQTALDQHQSAQQQDQARIDTLLQRGAELESELDAARRRVEEQEVLLAQVSVEKAATEQQLRSAAQELEAEGARRAEQEQRVNAVEAREVQLRAERDSISERLTLTESEQAAAVEASRVLSEELQTALDQHQSAHQRDQARIDTLLQRGAELESELDAARRQVEDQDVLLGQLSSEKAAVQEQLRSLAQELEAEGARRAEQEQRVNAVEAREAELRSERDSISERLTHSESEQAVAREEIALLSEKLQKVLDEHERTQQRDRARIDTLQQRSAELESELGAVRQRAEERDGLLAQLSAEKAAVEQQLRTLEQELEADRSQLAQQEQQFTELKAVEEQLRADLAQVNGLLDGAEQLRINAGKKNQFLSDELERLSDEHAESRRDDRQQIETLERRLEELDPALAAANSRIHDLEGVLAEASRRQRVMGQHAAALAREVDRGLRRHKQSLKTVTPRVIPVGAKPVRVERHADHHRSWTKVAAGFLFLLGGLASLTKLWDIDPGVVPQAGLSREVEVVTEPMGNDDQPGADQASLVPAETGVFAEREPATLQPTEAENEAEQAEVREDKPKGRQLLPPRQRRAATIERLKGMRAKVKGAAGTGAEVRAYLMEGNDAAAAASYDACRQGGGDAKDCSFLEQNMFEEAVIRLPSGVQYTVLRNGTGVSPGPEDRVLVNFRGMLLDGTEFDSTRRRGGPSSFRVDEAIPGLKDVLQYMEEGAKWEVYIPTELAFREPAAFGGQTVVFEIELLTIEAPQTLATETESAPADNEMPDIPRQSGAEEQYAQAEVEVEDKPDSEADDTGVPLWEQIEARTKRFLEENARKEGVIRLPSGLQYKVLEQGDGDGRSPQENDTVVVHYRGTLPDGRQIASTYEDGEPATLTMRQVMPAWREALLQMEEGERRMLYIPPELTRRNKLSRLGARVQQALVYEVELVEIK